MSLSDLLPKGASLPKLPSIVEDDQSKTKTEKTSATLDAAQQSFLSDLRSSVAREIQEHRAHGERIRKEIHMLLNRPHRGVWQSLWSLVDELSQFEFDVPTVVVFGGWHRATDCPKPPPSELIEDVYALSVYGEMLQRIDKCLNTQLSSPEHERALQAIWRWEEDQPWAFTGVFDSDSYSVKSLMTFSESASEKIIQQIRSRMLYDADNALIFYPSTGDIHAGWKDFLQFAQGLNYIPPSVLKSLGPFFLIMHTSWFGAESGDPLGILQTPSSSGCVGGH